MKRLDVSQLIEACQELGIDEDHALSDQLVALLEHMASAVANKLEIAACGVNHSEMGMLASFAPLSAGDRCPSLIEAADDEGSWQVATTRTLLVCGNDLEQARLARCAVERHGVTVIEARSAEEARKAYRQHRINLVITDTVLPTRRGFDLVQYIASLEGEKGGRRKVPVIAISQDATTGADRRVGDLPGVLASVPKPVNWEWLGPLVGQLCHAQRGQSDGRLPH